VVEYKAVNLGVASSILAFVVNRKIFENNFLLLSKKIFTKGMSSSLKPLIIPVTKSIDKDVTKSIPKIKSKDGIMKF
jgi:hypothetical protein